MEVAIFRVLGLGVCVCVKKSREDGSCHLIGGSVGASMGIHSSIPY